METITQSGNGNGAAPERLANLAVRVPKSVDRALEIEAARRDIRKRDLVEEALRAFLGMQAA
jgi:predicted HicB family RNase H-like nuclease